MMASGKGRRNDVKSGNSSITQLNKCLWLNYNRITKKIIRFMTDDEKYPCKEKYPLSLNLSCINFKGRKSQRGFPKPASEK